MIGISKLYCGDSFSHDGLRYGVAPTDKRAEHGRHKVQVAASERRPIVVWNTTRTCNLKCVHCYTGSENRKYPNELTTAEGMRLIDDLAEFGIPALLFSGGEPFMRPDIFDLAGYAVSKGLRVVFSTNATLITDATAKRCKELGAIYIGASLDGVGEVNDRFRGMTGAFDKTTAAIRACRAQGIKISLRLTLTKHNVADLDRIFRFVEDEDVERVCFYHLAYAGRAKDLQGDDLSHAESRAAVDLIMDRALDYSNRGLYKDIVTVDQHCDGVTMYLRMLREGSPRAAEARRMLEWNGGGANSSGVGIADIDPEGNVHPDQFWMDCSFGNVRERKFGDIWLDTSHPIMAGLKNRLPLLKGRCGRCVWQRMCGGSLRARAFAAYGDPWAEDPACYLTEEEISSRVE